MQLSQPTSLTILGSGGEIGASCFELSVNGYRILLDCGTHPKKDGRDALPALSLLSSAPDALLVSHAHQDHCGAVPYLLREFPAVRAHTTIPTMRIMDRMLHNSVAVMGLIARERGVEGYPLYEHSDVDFAVSAITGHEYESTFRLHTETPIEVTFYHAGHVLGSASILIKTPDHTLYYTGDICESKQELMRGYTLLPKEVRVDTLIIESTNGQLGEDKVFRYTDEIDRLGEEIKKTLDGGGVALIPSFALGRTQEVLNIAARLQEEGKIPDVPIYASGLGRAVYELYDRFVRYLAPDAVLRPLEQFESIGNMWKSKVVRRLIAEPCIIVATSGMMLENTPSALIAQQMVKHTKHGIFFVGYLDHETLGYKLLHSELGEALSYTLGGEPVPRRLENIQRFHFSAHAPRTALRSVIDHINPKNIIYVHGDAGAVEWMRDNSGSAYKRYAPDIGQTIILEA